MQPREDDESPSQFVAGFTWGDYIADLVFAQGSLTAVAERVAASHAWKDDVASIERALRRLRTRGLKPGGKWGGRLLAVFGLPGAVEARLRWMASYHSRFSDLPVGVCEDLVRLWDHPPTNERSESRVWIALARASIALRRNDPTAARACIAAVARNLPMSPVEARIEARLVEAYIEGPRSREAALAMLAEVEPWILLLPPGDDRACYDARLLDQRAFQLNRGTDEDRALAKVLYERIPTEDVPPFVLWRRANGLAYATSKAGDRERARRHALDALRFAGDGGHLRLRVMSLNMLVHIDPQHAEVPVWLARAHAITKRIEDDMLLARLERHRCATPSPADVRIPVRA